MGIEHNITATTFPARGRHLGLRVQVCFHNDTDQMVSGVIVRDDNESPFRTIIALDDGRFVLATECQYTPMLQ
jgi:hypothetical protein